MGMSQISKITFGANKAFAALLRRNNFTFSRPNVAALGVRAWGDITMTDTESGKERRDQVERYRVLARETTDPLAVGLLRDNAGFFAPRQSR